MAKEILQMELKIPSGPDVVTWVLRSGTGGRSEGQRETLMGKKAGERERRAVVPNLFGTRDQFHRRQFFPLTVGEGMVWG